jgi:hypothetical protein
MHCQHNTRPTAAGRSELTDGGREKTNQKKIKNKPSKKETKKTIDFGNCK